MCAQNWFTFATLEQTVEIFLLLNSLRNNWLIANGAKYHLEEQAHYKNIHETAKQTKSFLSQTFVPDQTSRQKTKEKNNTLWKILLR